MIHFLPGDQRRRHKFIDRTIDNYSEVLDRSEENSQSYLSESFIADHRTIIESLAVPNLRHGVLSMGKTAMRSEFYLPVYALHRNESVFFDIESSLQHPMQHRETMKFFHDHNLHDTDQIDQKMREFNVNNNHHFGPVPDAQAFVDSKILLGKSNDMNTVMIKGRPHTFFHMEDIYGNKSRRSSPDVVGHEFAHIIQRLIQPVQIANTLGDLDDIALRDELEAYNIQQDIILQMIQDDYAHRNEPLTYTKEWHGVSSFVFTINNLRNHYNKNREDKFFPDTGIRDTLHGLGIKVQASFVDDSIRHQEIF